MISSSTKVYTGLSADINSRNAQGYVVIREREIKVHNTGSIYII